ncbi:UNVERIFIED_CONTAM: hypothetical protein Sradi_3676600 [Sesamum radiatum]|uniref:Uncharacterized protein n=1 Tax=Sesamum radiatum TaxID=300843 RepID=A0AAW2QIZ1_SESRA
MKCYSHKGKQVIDGSDELGTCGSIAKVTETRDGGTSAAQNHLEQLMLSSPVQGSDQRAVVRDQAYHSPGNQDYGPLGDEKTEIGEDS